MTATPAVWDSPGPVRLGLDIRLKFHREGEGRQSDEAIDYENALCPRGKPSYHGRVDALRADTLIGRSLVQGTTRPRVGGGLRGQITGLTRRSRQTMVIRAKNLPSMVGFVGLTYPKQFPLDGRLVKVHLDRIGKWLQRRCVNAFWFLEFQRRGAPHIHLFTDAWIDKAELSAAWYKIVGSNDPKHLKSGTSVQRLHNSEGMGRYVSKYCSKAGSESKAYQKIVPPDYQGVGRLWGIIGRKNLNVKPVAVQAAPLREVAPTIRFARNLINARRRQERLQLLQQGKSIPRRLRPLKDSGRYSFVAWDTGPAVAAYRAASSSQNKALPPIGQGYSASGLSGARSPMLS